MHRFADTSGWGSYLDRSERFHSLALDTFADTFEFGGRIITSNWILSELTALLTSPLRIPKTSQIRMLDLIRSDTGVEIVTIDPILEAGAWDLWRGRPDKTWSLVDCSTFVLMNRRGLTDAITSDHHFEQAGFDRLLKPAVS